MNWYEFNPPPAWQWVGIGVTCAGTVLGVVGLYLAYAAAKDAKHAATSAEKTAEAARVAAVAARAAAEEFAAVYELQAIQDDLSELAAFCSSTPADLSNVARNSARLAARLGVAAASLRGDTRDSVERASRTLHDVSPEVANPRTQNVTKMHRIASTVAEVQATVTVAQRTLRASASTGPKHVE